MSDTTDGLPLPRRYAAIAALSFGTSMVALDSTIANVALPTIAADLGVAPSSAVLIVTVYQLALVMFLLPFSALGTRVGLRRMYQYGQLIFIAATMLCFFARSLPFLLVVRVMQALGAAATLSVSTALLRAVYPATQLGRGMAINNVVVSSVTALAPTLGGVLLLLASWPWLFAAAAPLALLSLWLGRGILPAPPPLNEPYDVPGAVLCALSFGLVIAGLEGTVHGDSPVVSLSIVAAGIAIAVLFVRRELRESAPILPVDLLARPVLALSLLSALLAFIASMALLLSLPFRLQTHYGFTPAQVGAVISPWPLAMLIVAPFAGMLSDRVSAGKLGGIGMALCTVGLLLMAFLPADVAAFDIAWRMALCGTGFGLFFAPNARLMIGATPATRVASMGGMISTTRLTGQTLGASLMATLLTMNVGDGRVPALVAAALTAVALVLSTARLNRSSMPAN